MKQLEIDYERLFGALRGRFDEVSEKALGTHATVLGRKVRTERLRIEELNKVATFLGRDVHDFLIEKEVN